MCRCIETSASPAIVRHCNRQVGLLNCTQPAGRPSMTLQCIEIETNAAPDAAVIWLHGLGADGHDFEPIVPELRLPPSLGVRFIFPHAPIRPVTINGGAEMRAWYDIDMRAPLAGEADIRASAGLIEELVDTQRSRGVATRRIVLAGFSQGGVIAMHLALRYGEPLAGVMALSTYLHDPEHLVDEISLDNAGIGIFMAHGLMDPMIPIARAVSSRETLLGLGYPVEWHEYAMGHSVCLEEINDIALWLRRTLAAT
jgi:phospholipase/carboxylesterase